MADGVAPVRSAAAALGLIVVAAASDVLLFLQPAGAILRPIEALALAVGALVAFGLALWAPRRELIAAPVIAFGLFMLSLFVVIDVPEDAVIRDAQSGLAIFVTVVPQLAVVACGVALSRRIRAKRSAAADGYHFEAEAEAAFRQKWKRWDTPDHDAD